MTIQVENVKKSFGTKPVLNEISFSVPEGEIFSLIGPNGAGKTTSLRCIFGDLQPERGKIQLFGREFHPRLKDRVAVMTEDRLTFHRFRGEDYVKLWKMLYSQWNDKIFSNFALHYRFSMDERVETFSMGMKTLFYIALTMASGADLLLLDEPTQNLDPVIRQEVLNLLRDYVHAEGKTVVISSHEIYELEEISTSFAIIREGTVLYSDSMDDAKEKHRLIHQGEILPEKGQVVGLVGNDSLVRTDQEIGRYPNFKELVLGYLKGSKRFTPFEDPRAFISGS